MGRPGVGPADGSGPAKRHQAGRVQGPRQPANGKGLPLLRHRSHLAGHPLGFCVRFEKPEFNGRERLLAQREGGIERRLRTLEVGGEEYQPIYGGEAVYRDGKVIGRLRSCGYGFTARRNLAYAYLPAGLGPDGEVEVEVFGKHVPARVTVDAVVRRESVKS
ncbi:MAG: aminomethyl transferase family protein [Chloroflexi bacterium]|nr:MAG: aminomethyl transferase family protein [Chloroflexota bacterium]